jgi:hypothetical protein
MDNDPFAEIDDIAYELNPNSNPNPNPNHYPNPDTIIGSGIMDNDPFAEIDDIAYELEVTTYKASGLPMTDASHVVVGNATIREKMCNKFEGECGTLIEEFGCVVIEQISSIDTTVFGHVDRGFGILHDGAQLDQTFCGGMPMLLCGQPPKPPTRRNSLVSIPCQSCIERDR